MASVAWDPDDRKPEEAWKVEAEIQSATPHALVKLTLVEGEWLVRALNPAAMCQQGDDFASRDVSDAVAEILTDNDVPATVRRRFKS
jgi:hypothetical protein